MPETPTLSRPAENPKLAPRFSKRDARVSASLVVVPLVRFCAVIPAKPAFSIESKPAPALISPIRVTVGVLRSVNNNTFKPLANVNLSGSTAVGISTLLINALSGKYLATSDGSTGELGLNAWEECALLGVVPAPAVITDGSKYPTTRRSRCKYCLATRLTSALVTLLTALK